MTKQRHGVWILFLLALGTILYWNSVHVPFLWDEGSLIVNDPRVHHWSRLPDIFLKPFLSGTGFARYYRPLVILSFRMDHMVWGFEPFGYHLTNLLFHLANTLLVYALFNRFFRHPSLSFWGAFLFLAHPAHVEAVTYIPGRVDLIPFFFILVGFHSYLIGRDAAKKLWPYFLSFLCYGFALLSKEMATLFPLVILAHLLLVDRKKTKFKGPEGTLLSGMLFLLGIYTFFRQTVSVQIPLKTLLDLPRLPLRLFVIPEILFTYARMWFFPWPLHMEHMIPIDILSVRVLVIEWSFLLLVLVGIFLFFRKRTERFWLLWIAVMLIPVLQIIPIYMSWRHLFISEHFVYFSSVGIIGLLLMRFGRFWVTPQGQHLSHPGWTVGLGAVLACFSFLVIWRNGEFRDRVTFFEQTLHYAPWSFRAYNQLGLAYLAAGDTGAAEEAFHKALSIEPDDGIPYVNLGFLSYKRGDFEKAEDYYQKALRLIPGDSVTLHNIGILHLDKRKWRKAVQFFEQAIESNPDASMKTYSQVAHAYWELGEKVKALEAVNQGLKRDPTHPELQRVKRWIEGKLREEVGEEKAP